MACEKLGLVKTTVAALYAIVGGMTLNDWSVLLGLVLVAVRLPIEVSNLHDWYVRKFKEPKRRRKSDRDFYLKEEQENGNKEKNNS